MNVDNGEVGGAVDGRSRRSTVPAEAKTYCDIVPLCLAVLVLRLNMPLLLLM